MGRTAQGDCYEMYMQTEPIMFGKYTKAKYELIHGGLLSYFFVTTCRPHDECLDILIAMAKLRNQMGERRSYRIFKTTQDAGRIEIHKQFFKFPDEG